MIIEADTRQQKDNHIIKYFDRQDIKWIRNKLYSGDYKLIDSTKIIIDTKKDLLEMCNNLCTTAGHNRIKKEVERANEIGCEKFIFLICEENIKTISEVNEWEVPLNWKTQEPRTKVNPEVLQKIMGTMMKRYNVEFIFTKKENTGETIVNILGGNNE